MTVAGQATGARARCAGLRHALLNEWQRGFPLEASPFQVLARRLGGSLREVLGHCHALAGEGALDAIRVEWSAAMQRVRWRCAVHLPGPPGESTAQALAALPGVAGWDWLALEAAPRPSKDAPLPTLCFDIVAHHEASARAQLAWFEARQGPVLCLPLDTGSDGAQDCGCAARLGPCSDAELARRCEDGLPLVAHPYRMLSESVQRTEREVMARLRRWQRDGSLGTLGLGSRAAAGERLLCAALVEGARIDRALVTALLVRPGVAEVHVLPSHADTAPGLLVVAAGGATQGSALLERALVACGLTHGPARLLRLHRTRVRPAPLLFADIGAGTAAAPWPLPRSRGTVMRAPSSLHS